MVFKRIKTRILDKGSLSLKGLIRVLQDHEDRLKALEGENSNTGSDDSNTGSDNQQQEQTPTTRNISFTINDGTDPIEGASVVIGETTKTTGSAGGCTFNDIADGSVSVEVSAEGYTTKTENITVSSENTSFTISLTASV